MIRVMAKLCEGRVCIVTGAGGGIGREHALLLAAHGAKVVVNDLGGSMDGEGASTGPAQAVAEEIIAAGGEAVANTDDVSSWDGAERMVQQAIDTFGGLDVLVNNAGILRDRMLVNMDEAEWDAVIKVHLKGTFAPARHAAAYWRDRSKAGEEVDARIINTTSVSGIYGNPGQTNYGAAKMGIAAFTIIAAQELQRYGVTVNAIAPGALTRMTEGLGGFKQPTPEQQAEMREGIGAAVDRPDLRVAGVAGVAAGDGPGVRGVRVGARRRRELAPRPDHRARPRPRGHRPDRHGPRRPGPPQRRHGRPGPKDHLPG